MSNFLAGFMIGVGVSSIFWTRYWIGLVDTTAKRARDCLKTAEDFSKQCDRRDEAIQRLMHEISELKQLHEDYEEALAKRRADASKNPPNQ